MRRCAILGNRRAMRPFAVMDRDQRTERAALLGANHRRAGSSGARLLPTIVLGLPKRSQEMTQKTQGTTRTPSRRGFLNRIFTIRPTTSRRGLSAPSCRGVNRANFHLRGTAGREARLVSLGVNSRSGTTATLPVPKRAALTGFSLNKSGARMVEDGSCEG